MCNVYIIYILYAWHMYNTYVVIDVNYTLYIKLHIILSELFDSKLQKSPLPTHTDLQM